MKLVVLQYFGLIKSYIVQFYTLSVHSQTVFSAVVSAVLKNNTPSMIHLVIENLLLQSFLLPSPVVSIQISHVNLCLLDFLHSFIDDISDGREGEDLIH